MHHRPPHQRPRARARRAAELGAHGPRPRRSRPRQGAPLGAQPTRAHRHRGDPPLGRRAPPRRGQGRRPPRRARSARRPHVHAPLDGLRHAPLDPQGGLHRRASAPRRSRVDPEARHRGAPESARCVVSRLHVWLVGATGLVGRATLEALLDRDEVARVTAFVRRPTGTRHAKLEERLVDFEALDAAFDDAERPDVAISCLGTTIKQAGTRERFRRVDHDYVLAFARAARAAGARRFLTVSSMGANARSLVFYSRVKGEVEDALAAMGFPAVTLARPSLLLGDRDDFRLGERLAAPFSKLLPKRLAGIEGTTVARALVRLALEESAGGTRVVPSDALARLGARD
ncbi:MAG: NAD(P)H-binding protein [Myxococcales bacterium]|nr:NAD(P)H-binding protein [Myxococcales bacterium]